MVNIPTGLWLDLIDFLESVSREELEFPGLTAERLLDEFKNLAP